MAPLIEDGFGEEDKFDVEDINEGIGIPLEEYYKEQNPDFDPKYAWTDVTNPHLAKATIGIAVGEGWEFAKKEMTFVREKLKTQFGTSKPTKDQLFDLVLGEQSEMYHTFKAESIFANYDEYTQFLSTFFLSSAYQVSTKQLFDKYSRIDLEGSMGKESYLSSWWKIGEASLPTRLERNKSVTPSGAKPFWMKTETAYNDFCREFFVKEFPGRMQTTVDDDKAHIQGAGYTAGLKTMRHTKDNVNGHTLHTLVYSFSQVPIQVTWERELNDSSEKAAERLYHSAITPMAASHGDLRHCATGMDRGYWGTYSLHEHAMKTGLMIKGATAMRQMSLGFNFSHCPDKTTLKLNNFGGSSIHTFASPEEMMLVSEAIQAINKPPANAVLVPTTPVNAAALAKDVGNLHIETATNTTGNGASTGEDDVSDSSSKDELPSVADPDSSYESFSGEGLTQDAFF